MPQHFILFFTLILFPFIGQSQTYQSGLQYQATNGFVSYHAGNLPILISVPHGGLLEPESIPNRSCNDCTTLNDTNTRDLGLRVQEAINLHTGCESHIVVNELHRKKMDANRSITEAALGNANAELAWTEYHAFMDSAKVAIFNSWGKGLVLDLHGHGHTIQRLELGYRINANQLRMSDSFLDERMLDDLPIRGLVENGPLSLSQIVRGEKSLGDLFSKKGYKAVPSPTTSFPEIGESYFRGGYITDRYGSKDGTSIDAIQIECHQDVRFDDNERARFADSLAKVIVEYVEIHYFENVDLNSCSTTSVYPIVIEEDIIYPNPVCGQIIIPSEYGTAKIKIYNGLGELFHYSRNSASINVSEWPRGMYFLVLEDGKEIISQKIIVQCP